MGGGATPAQNNLNRSSSPDVSGSQLKKKRQLMRVSEVSDGESAHLGAKDLFSRTGLSTKKRPVETWFCLISPQNWLQPKFILTIFQQRPLLEEPETGKSVY